ncbi:MAG: VOC family protein [Candidatus Brocadiae bacterium]|nr:VOC family protein [Candidatus Brocadiia bacterium]
MASGKTVFNAVGHIEISVSDLKRAAAFYKGLFGWTIMPALPGYWMWRDKGTMGGGLSLVPKSKIKAGSIVFYVGVRDIAATLKKAKTLGGKAVSAKRKIEGGDWGFCGEMKDPSGNLVGLWSPK